MAYELNPKQEKEVATDERLDAEEGVERKYPYQPIVDIIYKPIDLLAGSPSTEDVAKAKQTEYDKRRDSRNRR